MSIHKPKGYMRTPLLGAVELYSKVVLTTSGAIASQTGVGTSGFVVSKPSGTGIYRITTTDKWAGHLFLDVLVYNAGTARGQSAELKVKYSQTTKALDFHIVSDAGSAEDGNTGDELWIRLTMLNQALPSAVAL